MPTFPPDKNIERGDCKFKTCKNVICVKWMDNGAVTLIGSNVLRRQKGASSKSAVPYPIIVKKYLIFAIKILWNIILTDDPNFVFACTYFLI